LSSLIRALLLHAKIPAFVFLRESASNMNINHRRWGAPGPRPHKRRQNGNDVTFIILLQIVEEPTEEAPKKKTMRNIWRRGN